MTQSAPVYTLCLWGLLYCSSTYCLKHHHIAAIYLPISDVSYYVLALSLHNLKPRYVDVLNTKCATVFVLCLVWLPTSNGNGKRSLSLFWGIAHWFLWGELSSLIAHRKSNILSQSSKITKQTKKSVSWTPLEVIKMHFSVCCHPLLIPCANVRIYAVTVKWVTWQLSHEWQMCKWVRIRSTSCEITIYWGLLGAYLVVTSNLATSPVIQSTACTEHLKAEAVHPAKLIDGFKSHLVNKGPNSRPPRNRWDALTRL